MNTLKKKYVVYIALCTLIVTVGIFITVSDKVKADTVIPDGFLELPTINIAVWNRDTTQVRVSKNGSGLAFYAISVPIWQPSGWTNYYAGVLSISKLNNAISLKVSTSSSTANGHAFVYNNETYYGGFVLFQGNSSAMPLVSEITSSVNLPVIGGNFVDINSGTINQEGINYIFNNYPVEAVLNGTYVPPHESEYIYDSDIGSLVDVQFKNVIDETGESNFLDISYSKYTSTGRDLSLSGYGIMSRLVYNDPNDLDSIISFPEFLRPNITDSKGKKALKLITWGSSLYRNAIADSIADLFSGNNFNDYRFDDTLPGGGGHSFDFSQMDPYYDVILTPYYYDGSDYYYGDNTVINGVYFDQLGTRLVDDPDSDQTINITNVTINNYDYGVDSQYINNGDITNIDSMQVYNYTTYITDNSQTNIDNSINTTNNSTTNIYNSNNRYKPFDGKNLFQGVTAADLLTGLQSVITAFAMAFPIIGGLFDYLPWWAVDIAFTCTVVLAAMGTLKVLNIGNKINIGDLIGGGGS